MHSNHIEIKQLYIIGGTMGVGKTTVCQKLKRTLDNSVFLDGDWCWDMNPFVVNDETKSMVMDNICHTLNNFLRCSAYENVIFGWVMHEQKIIDEILANLDLSGCNVHCVSLICSEKALYDRLNKDIERNLRSHDIIERSVKRIPLYKKLNTIKIDVSGKSVEDTVKEIINL